MQFLVTPLSSRRFGDPPGFGLGSAALAATRTHPRLSGTLHKRLKSALLPALRGDRFSCLTVAIATQRFTRSGYSRTCAAGRFQGLGKVEVMFDFQRA